MSSFERPNNSLINFVGNGDDFAQSKIEVIRQQVERPGTFYNKTPAEVLNQQFQTIDNNTKNLTMHTMYSNPDSQLDFGTDASFINFREESQKFQTELNSEIVHQNLKIKKSQDKNLLLIPDSDLLHDSAE